MFLFCLFISAAAANGGFSQLRLVADAVTKGERQEQQPWRYCVLVRHEVARCSCRHMCSMSGCWREEKRKTKYCASGEKRARREKEERRRKRKRMRESDYSQRKQIRCKSVFLSSSSPPNLFPIFTETECYLF